MDADLPSRLSVLICVHLRLKNTRLSYEVVTVYATRKRKSQIVFVLNEMVFEAGSRGASGNNFFKYLCRLKRLDRVLLRRRPHLRRDRPMLVDRDLHGP